MYDILLKGGRLVDPSQEMNRAGSVAIRDGRIAAVGEDVKDEEAKEVLSLEGKIVTPGLIDLHCHPAAGFAEIGVPTDEIGLNSGVTLLCDGGTSGGANFDAMRLLIIDRCKTEVVCFLNLSNTGLIKIPEIWSDRNIDVDLSRKVIEKNRDLIKGIKVRAVEALAQGPGMKAIETAKKLATDLKLPLMMHIGETRRRRENDPMDAFSRAAVSVLERGDILSHYLTWEPGGMFPREGMVYPELETARRRGVILDSCHGLNHFSFKIARAAIEIGMAPDVISTDLSMVVSQVTPSLVVVMSKFLHLGLTLDQVIEMTTINAAGSLKEEGRRGSLKSGFSADITVMELTKGDYIYRDGTAGETIHGEVLLEPRMVLKSGKMMPAYSRYRIPPVYDRV